MIKVTIPKNEHTEQQVLEIPVIWEGVSSAQLNLTVEPSKKEANKFYWKASMLIEGQEKPVEKYGKLFEKDKVIADFNSDAEAICARMLLKAYMADGGN